MTVATSAEEVALGRQHGPQGARSLANLVLVHDVWGLSDHSHALAASLAAEGFSVLEIDLYREIAGPPTADPGAFIRCLSDPDVLRDLDRGADWLMEQALGRGRKVGIVGVCMGGTYAFLAACLSDRFSAAAPFYGMLSYETGMLSEPSGRNRDRKPHSPIELSRRLRMPLWASFGREDEFVPDGDVDALEAGLAGSGMRFTIDRYEHAGHAFLNRTRADAYRPEAAAQAWARIIPFLHAELD